MIKTTRILIVLLTFTFSTQAQTFQEISEPFMDYWFASSAIGDIDNDGDNDIIISGAVDTTTGGPDTSIATIYINENGVFTPSTNFQLEYALHIGDMELFDINNDGLLDIIITGLSYNDIVNYKLYTYINTGAGFELSQDKLGKIYGSIASGDFNNNGALDFVTNGTQYVENSGFVNQIDLFKNLDGDFEKSILISNGTQNGNIRLVDLNNDNKLDFIQIGNDTDYNPLFKIYKNTDGILEETLDLGAIGSGNIEVIDFNADGLLDIVAQGSDDSSNPVLKVYFNEGNFNFSELDLTSEATSNSSGAKTVAIGDFNSDGYNDFITIGEDSNYNGFTKIFLYNIIDQSFDVVSENTGLLGIGGSGNIIAEDINNDTQLDLLISGFADINGDYTGVTKLYKNLSTITNTAPEPPTSLEMEVVENNLLFSWSGATDDKTPSLGLQYEIRVGTTEGGSEIAKYKLTAPNWMLQIEELPESIYWAVKSIDASKLYSVESYEAEETILSTAKFTKENTSIYPNPATNYFNVDAKDDKVQNIKLYSQDGKIVLETSNTKKINISNLENGVYIVSIETATKQFSKKLIIN
ncbi:FG-GAP-like repeat-containing protein [Mesonia sp.]|uniref:FG-GAP-like repeat-containing protein n=1 Tax=Mesonia sp. TaxID=1960830 RepID=UPI003F9BAA0F